ncbi:MAG: hypothetical protein RLZZ298_863 [Pseudomonadota bacterium]
MLASFKQRLFRWHSDGSATFRLTQRRIFILPTRAGIVFAITLAAMFTGAINYDLALGHALVFLLTGLGLIGMIHTFRNLFALWITPGRAKPVFAGELAYFPIELRNDRKIARLGLELQALDNPSIGTQIAPEERCEVAIPVLTTQRGWLTLPRVRLSTVYPLGLLYAWSYLQPDMRCLVYPKPISTPLPPEQSTAITGERYGDGGQEDFAGFRNRQPADSLRHVAWKASARDAGQRPLQIKQFAGGAEQELQLDWQLTPEAADSEIRLSILCGWVLAAAGAGICYGLRLPGQETLASRGDAHRSHCLETLALFSHEHTSHTNA